VRHLAISLAMLSVVMARPGLAAGTLVTPETGSLPKGPVKRAARPKPTSTQSPARPDAVIEKDIRNRFAQSKIAADNYQVYVQGGVATIEGRTDVVQNKGMATRLARLGGATAVKNRIEISEAARQKAAQNLATGRRRMQIKRGDARSEARSNPSAPGQSH
jgi:BON domain